ncbi:MAG: 30S ribosome-binding factor RbfA [Actinomycetota bacterium]|nr:30S ribosome-binding factor RbfA [Actinomycetota bacterium]
MADPARARKLADRIRVVVAETLEMRVKDPRLGFITVTDTRVTNDLQQATVFYTVYGDETQRADTAAALESAKGVLRSEVGRQTGVRHTPSLTFVADAIPDTARHIEDLLRQAQAADAEVHRAATGASYAGEPDPYRAPRAEDDDAEDDDAEDGDAQNAGNDEADTSVDPGADGADPNRDAHAPMASGADPDGRP